MENLYRAFEQLNIAASEEIMTKFRKYMEMVLDWNEKINLTAIKEENEFVKKHFIDSILCAGFEEVISSEKVIDVGTGAGFPGIPLALIFPAKQFTLIDATRKKLNVLTEITQTLGMTNVKMIHARAEDLARNEEYREKFDLCVSRAVANLTVLLGYCLPFVTAGGSFISYKGPEADKEIKEAEGVIKALGGEIAGVRKASLEGFDLDHRFVLIKKRMFHVKHYR